MVSVKKCNKIRPCRHVPPRQKAITSESIATDLLELQKQCDGLRDRMTAIVARVEELGIPHDRQAHERTDAEGPSPYTGSATEHAGDPKAFLTIFLKRSTKQILMRRVQEIAEARKDELRMLLITSLRRTRFGGAM